MNIDAPGPAPVSLVHMPLYRRLALMASEGGHLREVAPRRYVCARGDTHVISAAAIRHAVDAGLLHRVRVRSYRLGDGRGLQSMG